MSSDLTVHLPNEPGELARLGTVLGEGGVNIDGFCALSRADTAEIHLLVHDAAAAFSALEGAGIDVVNEEEVLVIEVDDEPGMLGEIGRRLSEAGVNITVSYLATATRLVVAADNLAAAKAALG